MGFLIDTNILSELQKGERADMPHADETSYTGIALVTRNNRVHAWHTRAADGSRA
jgi:hypothetical protein